MISIYQLDILEKLLQFLGLLYLVFGLFMNYAWGCIKLDYQSSNDEIFNFWSPIASMTALLNCGHVFLIIVFLYNNWQHMSKPSKQDMNGLFYILSIPLFLASVAYIIMLIVRDVIIISDTEISTLLMHIGQLGFFCAAMSMIVIVNVRRLVIRSPFQKILMRFVMLITIIEIVHYFLFHIISQQINNFVSVASNYSEYSEFYGKQLQNKTKNPFGFGNIQSYMQPLMISFCCICVPYLIILKDLIEKNNVKSERRNVESTEDQESLINSSVNHLKINDASNFYLIRSLKLPPLSLVLGILLIAISLLIIVISKSLLKKNQLHITGQSLYMWYILFLYVISFILLFIQIHEMKRWPKSENNNFIDKILLWLGISGQLIIGMAQIQFYVFTKQQNLPVCVILLNCFLIFQTMVQYMVVTLALDREWIPPSIKTWQEYICPSVGMLSINLGLFLVGVCDSLELVGKGDPLFFRLFEKGYYKFGETLAQFQRFHAVLIFGKMTLITNRC